MHQKISEFEDDGKGRVRQRTVEIDVAEPIEEATGTPYLLLTGASIDRDGLVYRLVEIYRTACGLTRLVDELGLRSEFVAEVDRQNVINGGGPR